MVADPKQVVRRFLARGQKHYRYTDRALKRHWYNIALVSKGDTWPDQADFSDTDFEPSRPPSWGPAI